MTTPSAKPEVLSSSQPKANANPTAPAKHAPRSLDRLFNVDTSRALNVSLPSRYDPYYRFQDKPAVYAPYDPNVLEVMSKVGATAYSLTLSEDSRLWRLHELLHDPELMRQFMTMPRGWVVRIGPRGEEVEYNVEDLVNARLGVTTPSVSSSNTEPIVPDPCNTPRPSTPFVNRNREFLKATISWAGMYDGLDAQELLSRPTRSQSESQTSRPGSSTSTSRPTGMTRTTSLDAGLSENGREPSAVWKTPFEDAVSKEDLGEMLDQQAARDKGKAKEVSARNTIAELDVGESEPEDDDDGPGHKHGRALFSPMASDDDEEEEEASSKVGTADNSPFRPAPFRAWNDISSDEEDDEEVGKDKGKGKIAEKVSQEPATGDGPPTPAPYEDSPWRPSPYRAWNDVSSDEEDEQADRGRPDPLKSQNAAASTVSPTADRDVTHKANPSRILFKPLDHKSEQEGSTVTTLANSLFKPCEDESTDEIVDSDADLESGTVQQVLSWTARRHDLATNNEDEDEDEGERTEEDDMPADDRVPLVRHCNSRRNGNLVPDESRWSSEDDGDDEDGGSEDEVEEEEEEEEPQDREHIASALRAIFRSVNGGPGSDDEAIGHGSMLVRSMFQRGVEDSDSDSEDGQEDEEGTLVSEQVGELAEARVSYVEAETSSDSEASEVEDEDGSGDEDDTGNDNDEDDHHEYDDDENADHDNANHHENDDDDNDDDDSDRHDNDHEDDDNDDHANSGGSGGDGKDNRGDDYDEDDQNQDDAGQGDDGNDRNDKNDKDAKYDKNEKIYKNDRKGKAARDDDGSEADDEQDGERVEEEEEDDTILPDGVANIDDDGWRRIVTYTNGVKVFSGSKYWRWFPVIPNKIVTTPSFDLPPDSADEYELDDEPAEWYKGRTPPTPRWPPPKSYHGEKFNVCQYSESSEEYHSEDEHVPGPDAVCGRVKMEFHAKQLAEKLQRIEWWRGQTSILKLSVNWAVRFGYRDPWL